MAKDAPDRATLLFPHLKLQLPKHPVRLLAAAEIGGRHTGDHAQNVLGRMQPAAYIESVAIDALIQLPVVGVAVVAISGVKLGQGAQPVGTAHGVTSKGHTAQGLAPGGDALSAVERLIPAGARAVGGRRSYYT